MKGEGCVVRAKPASRRFPACVDDKGDTETSKCTFCSFPLVLPSKHCPEVKVGKDIICVVYFVCVQCMFVIQLRHVRDVFLLTMVY